MPKKESLPPIIDAIKKGPSEEKTTPKVEQLLQENSIKNWLCCLVGIEKAVTFVTDPQGNTALFHASRKGYLGIMRLLLDAHAPVNHANKKGFTALHGAAQADQKEAVELLIQHKADVNATPFAVDPTLGSDQRKTPLFLAAASKKTATRVVEPLLKGKADPNIGPEGGLLPIHFYAALGKHSETVLTLLLAGAAVILPTPPRMTKQNQTYYQAKEHSAKCQYAAVIARHSPLIAPLALITADYAISEIEAKNYQDDQYQTALALQ